MTHFYDKYHINHCFINFYTTFEYQISYLMKIYKY